jgi:hypothetical protein
MSGDFSVVEKFFEYILMDLIVENIMFAGAQDSSKRGVQTSPSTSCRSGPSRIVTEKQTKHHDDLANENLIPSILPDYIPPQAGAVSRDSVSRDFDNTLIIAYLPKGIRTIGPQLERILMLNISEFNLGY